MSPFSSVPLLSLPERIRVERKRLGLNQDQFAELGGVSRTAQYTYESGRNWPTCQYLESLRAAGVDVAFIATGKRSESPTPDWNVIRHAFLLVQHNLAERADRAFTPDQLFDAFKTAVEAATGVSRADLTTPKVKVSTRKKVLQDE